MPTFFVESAAVTPPVVRVSGSLLHHVRDALRLSVGDDLLITDNHRRRYRTRVTSITAQVLESRIVDTIVAPVRTSPLLVLAQAILKGEKMDWVIQKATELGVDRIIPVQTKHTVVRLHTDRIARQQTRWQKIAHEAAQQSERWTIPIIDTPVEFSQLMDLDLSGSVKYILAERTPHASLSAAPLPGGQEQTILLLIGPEGGWDGDEHRIAEEHKFIPVTLGTRILRAETAALAALSIIQSRLGELG